MKKSFRFFAVLCFLLAIASLFPTYVNAQVPQIKLPCEKQGQDFHSLRPYQAAPCGDANKALYCSNDLQFIEDFNVEGRGDCQARGVTGTFECNPNLYVPPHDLFVELDDSQFPIEGNTENVKNSQNSADEFDDATKVNEYVSWYLSGVNNRAEYGIPTEDQIVNYSGPIQKLIPQAIQEAVRISSIEKATKLVTFTEEADSPDQPGLTISGPETHNQVVACAQGESAVECPKGEEVRLKDFDDGSLSVLNTFFNGLGASTWVKRYPPLPWQFKTPIEYNKAYNEWRGNTCSILPIVNTLVCADIPGISPSKKWSNLFSYVPLAVTPDKKGAEYITDVQIKPAEGTGIIGDTYGKTRNAPLYFAHTAETKDASALLNTTYAPKDVKSVPLPKSTETNNCSIVNVRTNPGDNLFPGDPEEMQVQDVSYTINQAKCEEKHKVETICPQNPAKCGGEPCCEQEINELDCNAEVFVTILTKTKTPFADELFSQTVADSMSTFRKIYPKVDSNSPVYCIADIPTVTNVTYDTADSQIPPGGDLTFKVKKNPKDGAEDSPQLAFPHIGSVYDYFLKGIQTALRPKEFAGEQPISAQTCTNISCGELPKALPKASGSCSLGGTSSRIPSEIPQSLKDIINAAAQTYKVPPNLIVAWMFGEGLFETGRFNWTDQNVKNWATCMPIPNCNTDGDDNFMGFFPNVWENVKAKIAPDLKKLDPTRKEPSQCNLLDAVYGVAWNLHDSADGGGPMAGKACFGIPLSAPVPTSCSWSDSQYESAIKVGESGYTDLCLTKENSCLTGGGEDAACPSGDTCETISSRYLNPSHNACVWDVAHGN